MLIIIAGVGGLIIVGSDYHIKQAYLTCMTQNNQFDKLEDDIYRKVKRSKYCF